MSLKKILLIGLLFSVVIIGGCIMSIIDRTVYITDAECKERGGRVFSPEDVNNPTCPDGKENLGELSDVYCDECICCR